jgi:phage gp29-like protein
MKGTFLGLNFSIGRSKDKPAAPKKGELKRSNNRSKYVVTIDQQINYRSVQDLKKFIAAMRSAENIMHPRRMLLYNLFDDLMLDGHLSGLIEHTIINRVLAENFAIVNADGSEDTQLTQMLQSQWFEDFVTETIKSKYYGHSLIQITVEGKGENQVVKCVLIPRRHVRQETGEILNNPNDDKGWSYLEDDVSWCLVEVGKPEDLGLLCRVAPYVIIKKFGITNWSEYAELFGMPLRYAKLQSKDPDDYDRMADEMERMGASGWAVLGPNEDISFVEATRTDAFKVYDQLAERCNKEMSKALTGQTLTADAGDKGARSLGDVHMEILDAVIESLKRFVTYTCNDGLLPTLAAQGINVKGKKFKYNQVKDLDALFKRVIQLLEHFDIEDIDWIVQEFGIPVKPKAQAALPQGDEKKK